MSSLKINEVLSLTLEPGRKIVVSGNAIVILNIEGTDTKKVIASGGSFTFHRYLLPVHMDITALGDVTVTESADSAPVSPGEYLSAQVAVETEHLSPNQYGGYFGTVYRQYHSTKTNAETITATGITKLIAVGGRYNTTNTYSGDLDNGTSSLAIAKGTNQVVFSMTTYTCNEGWVDYVK